MMPAFYPLPFLTVTVVFLVRAGILNKRAQIYFFKPVSTLLVISIAALSFADPHQNQVYTWGILIGLVLSFGGDLALLFQEKRSAFLLGLGFFLLAHITYTIVFTLLGRFTIWDLIPATILIAAAVCFYILIKPNLGKMKIPVIAYIVIISVMVSRAVSTFNSPVFTNKQAWMIIAGAVLFYLSDVILAANKFLKPWKYNRISLSFYYSGQALIALAASCFIY